MLKHEGGYTSRQSEYARTVPPQQYSESVNTEYDSLYSIDSEDDMGLEGIRLKGLKILNEFDSMLDEFIEYKRDWAKVCRSIKQSEYNSKKDKMAVIEIMEKCVQLSVKMKEINKLELHKEKPDIFSSFSEDDSESEDEGSNGKESEKSSVSEDKDENESIGDAELQEENGSIGDAELQEENEDEDDDEEDDFNTQFNQIVFYLECGIKDLPWATDLYEKMEIKEKIESTISNEDSDVEEEYHGKSLLEVLEEEDDVAYDDIHFNNAKPEKVKKMLNKIVDGVKFEGKQFIKRCSDNEIKFVGVCCNMFHHDRYGLGGEACLDAYKQIYKFYPQFLKIADPHVNVKKKRKLLMKRQVGNGVFSVLASTILPIIMAHILSK